MTTTDPMGLIGAGVLPPKYFEDAEFRKGFHQGGLPPLPTRMKGALRLGAGVVGMTAALAARSSTAFIAEWDDATAGTNELIYGEPQEARLHEAGRRATALVTDDPVLQEIGGSVTQLGGGVGPQIARTVDRQAAAFLQRMSSRKSVRLLGDEVLEEGTTFVVRGGLARSEHLAEGTGSLSYPPGSGFSVQSAPGASLRELIEAGAYPNSKVSVTTTKRLREVGEKFGRPIDVVHGTPGRGQFHSTVSVPHPLPEDLAEALSETFRRIPNPNVTRKAP